MSEVEAVEASVADAPVDTAVDAPNTADVPVDGPAADVPVGVPADAPSTTARSPAVPNPPLNVPFASYVARDGAAPAVPSKGDVDTRVSEPVLIERTSAPVAAPASAPVAGPASAPVAGPASAPVAAPALAGFTRREPSTLFGMASERNMSHNPFYTDAEADQSAVSSRPGDAFTESLQEEALRGKNAAGASVFREEFSFEHDNALSAAAPTEPTTTIRAVRPEVAQEMSPNAPSDASFDTAHDARRLSREPSMKATEPLRIKRGETRGRAPSIASFMTNASSSVERTMSRISSQLHLRPSMSNMSAEARGAPTAQRPAGAPEDPDGVPGSYIY